MRAAELLARADAPAEMTLLLSADWNSPNASAEELLRRVEAFQRDRAALAAVFRDEALNTELDAELAYHLAETVDRLVDAGMPQPEAWIAARRLLGNYAIQKERSRDMNVAAWLDQVRADVVYGIRQLP